MHSLTIVHQEPQQQFVAGIPENQARLQYEVNGQNINFHHTFVPDSMRGQGVAQQLVERGLEWANSQNYVISASCSYVQKFL
ncbi:MULTISPECIES: GNAT family N-acetyltransferase [Shewanella]|uniref:GNAT family N-acetyltransferase n=1 Tax=Shewanella TaxID=22 RepID=UPI00048CD3BC|nr:MULTISPECIES: GNAT family N-acetyltransferase [Shewanella]QLE83709.1 N-acetyltransferase [Shewanella sp. Scap07]